MNIYSPFESLQLNPGHIYYQYLSLSKVYKNNLFINLNRIVCEHTKKIIPFQKLIWGFDYFLFRYS